MNTRICLKFDDCIIFQTPREGAQTTIYCAVSPALVCTNGKYFAECQASLSVLYSKNYSKIRSSKFTYETKL